ncbi:hypothetical protein PCE1_004540 [Barthelona sp. PCE]
MTSSAHTQWMDQEANEKNELLEEANEIDFITVQLRVFRILEPITVRISRERTFSEIITELRNSEHGFYEGEVVLMHQNTVVDIDTVVGTMMEDDSPDALITIYVFPKNAAQQPTMPEVVPETVEPEIVERPTSFVPATASAAATVAAIEMTRAVRTGECRTFVVPESVANSILEEQQALVRGEGTDDPSEATPVPRPRPGLLRQVGGMMRVLLQSFNPNFNVPEQPVPVQE